MRQWPLHLLIGILLLIDNCYCFNSFPVRSKLWRLSSHSNSPHDNALDFIRKGPNAIEIESFRDIPGISDWLVDRCEVIGFKKPTIVQETAIPPILAGEDIVLQALTGSGKTLAYVLPLLSKIDPSRCSVQAVIIVPTRELGLQVSKVLRNLAHSSPIKMNIMPLLEGSKNIRQIKWVTVEPPHIIICNLSSLQYLISINKIKLNAINHVVIDEIDAILSNNILKSQLHSLLSRRLSSTFKSLEEGKLIFLQ